MSNLTREAVVQEICAFLCRGSSETLARIRATGTVQVSTMVSLVLYILHLDGGRSQKHSITRQVRAAARLSQVSKAFDLAILAEVIHECFDIELGFDHMSVLLGELRLLPHQRQQPLGALQHADEAERPQQQVVERCADLRQRKLKARSDGLVSALQTSHNDIAVQLVNLQAEKDAWVKQRNEATRRERDLAMKYIRLKEARAQEQEEHAIVMSLVNYRPKKKRVSVLGGYNLAVLRQNGQVSGKSLVLVAAGSAQQGSPPLVILVALGQRGFFRFCFVLFYSF